MLICCGSNDAWIYVFQAEDEDADAGDESDAESKTTEESAETEVKEVEKHVCFFFFTLEMIFYYSVVWVLIIISSWFLFAGWTLGGKSRDKKWQVIQEKKFLPFFFVIKKNSS